MTIVGVSLRQAAPDDVSAIAVVHVEGWRWAYRGQMPDSLLDGLSVERRAVMWRDVLAMPATETRVWLAERDGQLIGFAATGVLPEAGDPPLTAQLTAIYLVKDAAGSGAGRALLQHATQDLRQRGFRAAVLWVLASNARARRFYERAGWRPDGATKTVRRESVDLLEVRYSCDLESAAGGTCPGR